MVSGPGSGRAQTRQSPIAISRHLADVNADSLFEVAVLALRAFKVSEWTEASDQRPALRWRCASRRHVTIVSIGQIQRWTEGAEVGPPERLKRERLKVMLRDAGVP
jgi:hypothetical protein